MKKSLLLSLLFGAQLVSCSPDNPVVDPSKSTSSASNEAISALFQQFHGKYKVLSSVSSQAVDVNLDGHASTNLLEEISDLKLDNGTKYNVEVRIYGPSDRNPKSSFSLLQWWPEQFIRTGPGQVWNGGDLLSYTPDLVVKYDFQGVARSISFATDLKQITVHPSPPENAYRWVRPESVSVEAGNRLQVVTKKRLYTREGVKEVTITSVYEHFTMKT